MSGKRAELRRLQAFEAQVWNPWRAFRERYALRAGEMQYVADQAEDFLAELHQDLMATARETEARPAEGPAAE